MANESTNNRKRRNAINAELKLQKLLTSREIADVLSVSERTIFNLTNREENPLPCARIGRSVRYDLTAVREWLANQK